MRGKLSHRHFHSRRLKRSCYYRYSGYRLQCSTLFSVKFESNPKFRVAIQDEHTRHDRRHTVSSKRVFFYFFVSTRWTRRKTAGPPEQRLHAYYYVVIIVYGKVTIHYICCPPATFAIRTFYCIRGDAVLLHLIVSREDSRARIV